MQKVIKRFYNIDDWNRYHFNCFGFAMGIPEWLRLEDFRFCFMDDYNNNEEWNEDRKDIFEDCIQNILDNFTNVRQINNEAEASRKEVVFFFRLAEDDFHFVMKVGKRYFHKTGNNVTLKEMTKEQVYSDNWCGRYDSDIAIFARKKDGKSMW